MNPQNWPAWWYGPQGQAAVFQRADDVPEGWRDSPAALTFPPPEPAPEPVAPAAEPLQVVPTPPLENSSSEPKPKRSRKRT